MSTPDAEELAERLWTEIKPKCIAIIRQALSGGAEEPEDEQEQRSRARAEALGRRMAEELRLAKLEKPSPTRGKRAARP